MALSKLIHRQLHVSNPSLPKKIVNVTPPKKPMGAGDLAEKIIKPFAKLSDATLGTKLVDCVTCVGGPGTDSRKERWNEAIPDISNAPSQIMDMLEFWKKTKEDKT